MTQAKTTFQKESWTILKNGWSQEETKNRINKNTEKKIEAIKSIWDKKKKRGIQILENIVGGASMLMINSIVQYLLKENYEGLLWNWRGKFKIF